jgi:hypothetical protein
MVGWAHAAYEEFLAAWYIRRRGYNFGQIVGMLRAHDSAADRVAPQLSATAAWIASRNDDLFKFLCLHDPETLLSGDVAGLEPRKREELTGKILAAVESGKWSLSELPRPWGCRPLGHSGLSEQILPFIRDPSRGWLARWFSISIAAGCRPCGVAEHLATVALDPSEQVELRAHAAGAVIEIGDVEQMARLRPLAEGSAGDDPVDELKGVGLRATWPGTLAARDLFRLLTWPKNRHYSCTAYLSFLERPVGEDLGPADLPIALDWVSGLDLHQTRSSPFWNFSESIVRSSLQHIGHPAVFASLTALAANRLRSGIHPLRELAPRTRC